MSYLQSYRGIDKTLQKQQQKPHLIDSLSPPVVGGLELPHHDGILINPPEPTQLTRNSSFITNPAGAGDNMSIASSHTDYQNHLHTPPQPLPITATTTPKKSLLTSHRSQGNLTSLSHAGSFQNLSNHAPANNSSMNLADPNMPPQLFATNPTTLTKHTSSSTNLNQKGSFYSSKNSNHMSSGSLSGLFAQETFPTHPPPSAFEPLSADHDTIALAGNKFFINDYIHDVNEFNHINIQAAPLKIAPPSNQIQMPPPPPQNTKPHHYNFGRR